MKHLRKILAVALVSVMALAVLTGCGKSEKNYQNELSSKLKSANIGVTTTDQLNADAETVAKSINQGAISYISKGIVDGGYTVEELISDVIRDAHLGGDTKFCISVVSSTNQYYNVGFDGTEDQVLTSSDFFVRELKTYNEKNTTKLTVAGVGVYKIPFVADVVILLAR